MKQPNNQQNKQTIEQSNNQTTLRYNQILAIKLEAIFKILKLVQHSFEIYMNWFDLYVWFIWFA